MCAASARWTACSDLRSVGVLPRCPADTLERTDSYEVRRILSASRWMPSMIVLRHVVGSLLSDLLTLRDRRPLSNDHRLNHYRIERQQTDEQSKHHVLLLNQKRERNQRTWRHEPADSDRCNHRHRRKSLNRLPSLVRSTLRTIFRHDPF
jgi:hypothetical protein